MQFQNGDYVQIAGHWGKIQFHPSWYRIDGIFHRNRKAHVELYTDQDVMDFIEDKRNMYDYIVVMRGSDVIYG